MSSPAITASLAYLPDPRFWWGAASALGFVLLLRIGPRWFRGLGRRASQCPQPVLPAPAAADEIREQSDYWESPEVTEGDRRRRSRRGGNPTPVFVLGADGDEPQKGYVLDRSSGGLRLAVPQIAPVGTALRLRACHAPQDTPWAEASVCWSFEASGRREVGCRFTATPPWSVLLLFG